MNNLKNSKDDVRPPSLNGLKEAVTEMMDIRTGKRPKQYVERKRKSL